MKPIKINGAFGEGGGQIIRTALAMSMTTGQPVHVSNIRAKRKKPGLLRQHLTALNAAARICDAEVEGNELGSTDFTFMPHAVRAGDHTFRIGTAGSATLVLQTILPALMLAREKSTVAIEGGTHNPFAPPYPFLEQVFVPQLDRMGFRVETKLERHGFYPAGGGRIVATIQPCQSLKAIYLLERTHPLHLKATALLCHIQRSVGERELQVIERMLSIPKINLVIEQIDDAPCMGNALMCSLSDGLVAELITGFGERGVFAEQVAKRVADEAREYIDAQVPVGRHLADQLMLPMALVGAGSFRTLEPTMHALTNIEIIKQFSSINAGFTRESEHAWRFELKQGAGL